MKIYRNKPIQAGRGKSPMGRRIVYSNPLTRGTKQGERITNQKMHEKPFSMSLTELEDTEAYKYADVIYFIDKNGQEIDIKESDYDKYVVDGYQGYSDAELEVRVHEKSDVKSSVRRNRKAIKAGFWNAKQTDDEKTEYMYDIAPDNTFYFVDGTSVVWTNNANDPWIEYNGYLYNFNDAIDMLWDEYVESCNDIGYQPTDDDFDHWISTEQAESVLMDMQPFAKVTYSNGDTHIAESINASVDAPTNRKSSIRTEFQSFLDKVDRQVSDALYQYDDAMWDVKGTMTPDDHSYWCELNLYCDGEEAGTVNIECIEESGIKVRTDALVVTVSDSDTIQAEGTSFNDIFDTCVGELIRLAEDYVNFVRIKY